MSWIWASGSSDEPSGAVDHEADRRAHPQLPPPGLVELSPEQPGAQHVQLGFTHRALEAQEQAIVKVTRVVDAVLVEDERLGEGADFQEPMPVRRIARQA